MTKTVNVTIVTEKKMFPAGTVAGNWMITMQPADGSGDPMTYHGPDPFAFFEIEETAEPVTYKCCGVRVDPAKQPLGNVVCENFKADPSLVEIEVAGAISISYADFSVSPLPA